MLPILVLVVIFLLTSILVRKNGDYWKSRKVGFEKPLLLFGNIIDVMLSRRGFAKIVSDLYFKFNEPFFGIWVLNDPQLVIRCPGLIRNVLAKDFDHFQDRHVTCNEEIDSFAANTLFLMKHPKWKRMRAKVLPMFSFKNLKCIHGQSRNIAKTLVSYIGTFGAEGEIDDVKELCQKYVVEAIGYITFGIRLQRFQSEKLASTIGLEGSGLGGVTYTLHFCKSILVRIFKLKLVGIAAKAYIGGLLFDVLERRKSLTGVTEPNVLDVLNQGTNETKSDEIVARISEFLIASYHSTSSAIALALYELSLNSTIQDKLRQEICANLDKDGDVSYAALSNMEYLDKVVSETLRKYPIVPVIGRTCVRSYKIPDGALTIEKGIRVLIPLNALHHDPKYYPEPELFDPERFTSENIREKPSYCYLPFGGGPRKCVGKKMAGLLIKLAVAYIIKDFQIEVDEGTALELHSTSMNAFADIRGKFAARFKYIR